MITITRVRGGWAGLFLGLMAGFLSLVIFLIVISILLLMMPPPWAFGIAWFISPRVMLKGKDMIVK